MREEILNISGLSVGIGEKQILHEIDLKINAGETHVLMGPNGAGKSTLGYALMGNPKYEILSGSVAFRGEDLLEKSVDKRAAMGLFLSFQNPVEVQGVSLGNFVKSALDAVGERKTPWKFRKKAVAQMKFLQMDEGYLDRALNVGFSGGEKKKAEIFQMLMLHPALAILDETDSGLDVDAVKTVSLGVEKYQKEQNGALLIITHSTRILESLHVDHTHVMADGRIAASGDASLIDSINENGFEAYIR